MKYKLEVIINLPRKRVIELFDSPDNMKKWQPSLISFEHISGTLGQVGAKSKLIQKIGRKEIEMIETVTERNFPDKFSATYIVNNVYNLVENTFTVINDECTKWEFKSEFQCKGFMRIMAFLLPSVFKKESLKFMNQFKEYAEKA